jgi:P27 family predicted phage terminase small subunit
MGQTELKPPKHLKAATRRWWAEVCARWVLEEHHQRVLTLAGEAWDVAQEAGALIRREGLTVTTKAGGPRAHPCVKIAAEARLQFFRGIRELDLDLEPPAQAKRPPTLRSIGK